MDEAYMPLTGPGRPLGLINPRYEAGFRLDCYDLLGQLSQTPSGTEVTHRRITQLVFVHTYGDTVVSAQRKLSHSRTPSGTHIHRMSAISLIGTASGLYGEKHRYTHVWRGPDVPVQFREYPETVEPLAQSDIQLLQSLSRAAAALRQVEK